LFLLLVGFSLSDICYTLFDIGYSDSVSDIWRLLSEYRIIDSRSLLLSTLRFGDDVAGGARGERPPNLAL
jgi:hypothetical protein